MLWQHIPVATPGCAKPRFYYDTALAPREMYNPFVLRKLKLPMQVVKPCAALESSGWEQEVTGMIIKYTIGKELFHRTPIHWSSSLDAFVTQGRMLDPTKCGKDAMRNSPKMPFATNTFSCNRRYIVVVAERLAVEVRQQKQ